jgi:hypothetical protein
MTPVAPHGPDIEQDGLIFSGCAGKGFGSPFMPLDWLVHGGTEIRGGGAGEGVRGLCHLSQVYLGSDAESLRFASATYTHIITRVKVMMNRLGALMKK